MTTRSNKTAASAPTRPRTSCPTATQSKPENLKTDLQLQSMETNSAATAADNDSSGGGDVLSFIKASDIQSHDVLCGRDKATFNFIGNRRFREFIGTYIPRYAAAKTKREKAAVIVTVTRKLRNEAGSRFLKKYNKNNKQHEEEHDNKNHEDADLYIELDEIQARKKCGHALRDLYVARSQKNARHAAAAISSSGAAVAVSQDTTNITTKSKRRRRSSQSSNNGLNLEDENVNNEVMAECGLDDDRRKSDVFVVAGSGDSIDKTDEFHDTNSQKPPRRRRLIENSFSEESFSDSISSMLPFVEDTSHPHEAEDSMEPLPAFSRPSSQQQLSESHDDHEMTDHETDTHRMMPPPPVPPPLPFQQPVFTSPTVTARGVHPYSFHEPPSTHIPSHLPSHPPPSIPPYAATMPYPQPAMQFHPLHPQMQLQLQRQHQQPQPQQQMDMLDYQQHFYHMYHHHHYHHYRHPPGGGLPRGCPGADTKGGSDDKP